MASSASRTWAAAAALAAGLGAARSAAADPYQLGGFFGPRFFSGDSELGRTDEFRTTLQTTVAFGPRLARPLLEWLVPELELPMAAATTEDLDVSVFWIEPRAHARFVWTQSRVRPFALLGAGVPMTASSKRRLYGSDITWEGYGGIGALYSPGRGLSFRFDLRIGVTDGFQDDNGEGTPVAVEVEATAGLFFELGGRGPRKARGGDEARVTEAGDRDGDHVADDADRCPDRAEDEDGFDDKDGCPDIDNDLDRVLDIADACPSVPETFNGFEDEDGCQDSVPGDLDGVLGTIEGLLYEPGATEVPGSASKALDGIAEVLKKYPATRIVVIGHTDDREAEIEAIADEPPEETAQRQADALVELGRARAAAVEAALVDRGIPGVRTDAASQGGADPVSENDKPRGRLRNRRVELKLYVPER
jgi:outer membrane protein OmpA-like peptidoglycan-associated protein